MIFYSIQEINVSSIIEKDTYTPYFASQIAIVAVLYTLMFVCSLLLSRMTGVNMWDKLSSIKGGGLVFVGSVSYLYILSRMVMLVKVIRSHIHFSRIEKLIRFFEVFLIALALLLTPIYQLV